MTRTRRTPKIRWDVWNWDTMSPYQRQNLQMLLLLAGLAVSLVSIPLGVRNALESWDAPEPYTGVLVDAYWETQTEVQLWTSRRLWLRAEDILPPPLGPEPGLGASPGDEPVVPCREEVCPYERWDFYPISRSVEIGRTLRPEWATIQGTGPDALSIASRQLEAHFFAKVQVPRRIVPVTCEISRVQYENIREVLATTEGQVLATCGATLFDLELEAD